MKKFLPARAICERYDICDRTVDRWAKGGVIPQPQKINGRNYWDTEELDAADAERKSKTGGA